MRRILGTLLFLLSLAMLIWGLDFHFTGNIVQDYFSGGINFLQILGFVFLIGSVFLFIENKGLEYYVIPTGWENSRIKKAEEEFDKKKFDKIIITGNAPGWQHRNKIYKAVRKKGISRDDIRIVDGIDSEEDVLYLGDILKKGDTVYFDTFPAHYAKYKQLIKKAKRDNLFPEGVEIKLSKIEQNGLSERLYYVSALEEALKNKRLEFKKNREPSGADKIKNWVKKRGKGYNE